MSSANLSEQQLWEFVYGLLSEQEAEEVRRRITSDPDVARAYVRVKQQSELVAEAARRTDPELVLGPPKDAAAIPPHAPSVTSPRRHNTLRRRWLPWSVAAAATVLFCVIGWQAWYSPVLEVAQAPAPELHLVAKVSVPGVLSPEVTNGISILTTDPEGTPRPVELNYRVVDDQGQVRLNEWQRTGADGAAQIPLPPSIAKSADRMEVQLSGSQQSMLVRLRKAVSDSEVMGQRGRDLASAVNAAGVKTEPPVAEMRQDEPAPSATPMAAAVAPPAPAATPIRVTIAPEGFAHAPRLVADWDNRVYFRAQKHTEEPLSNVTAQVVASDGNLVAETNTSVTGRGLVRFTPEWQQHYEMQLEESPQRRTRFPMPPVRTDSQVALRVEPSVLEHNEQLHITLYSTVPSPSFLIAAYARNALVAQRLVSSAAFQAPDAAHNGKMASLALPLPDDAIGAMQVVVFDVSQHGEQGSRPIAGRLVYRHPNEPIEIDIERDLETAPDVVELSLRDGRQRPVPGAVFVSVASLAPPNKSVAAAEAAWIPSEPNLEELDLLLGTSPVPAPAEQSPRYIARRFEGGSGAFGFAYDEGMKTEEESLPDGLALAAPPAELVPPALYERPMTVSESTSVASSRRADRVGWLTEILPFAATALAVVAAFAIAWGLIQLLAEHAPLRRMVLATGGLAAAALLIWGGVHWLTQMQPMQVAQRGQAEHRFVRDSTRARQPDRATAGAENAVGDVAFEMEELDAEFEEPSAPAESAGETLDRARPSDRQVKLGRELAERSSGFGGGATEIRQEAAAEGARPVAGEDSRFMRGIDGVRHEDVKRDTTMNKKPRGGAELDQADSFGGYGGAIPSRSAQSAPQTAGQPVPQLSVERRDTYSMKQVLEKMPGRAVDQPFDETLVEDEAARPGTAVPLADAWSTSRWVLADSRGQAIVPIPSDQRNRPLMLRVQWYAAGRWNQKEAALTTGAE